MTSEYGATANAWSRAQPMVSTVVRLALGGIFIVAGALKISDVALAKLSVQAYQIFPRDLANIIGVFLPVLEIALGLLLLFGVATRYIALTLAVLLIGFMLGVASLSWRGIETQCGCFGTTLIPQGDPDYAGELIRDGAMLLGALWLVAWPRSYLSIDGWLARRADGYADPDPDAEPDPDEPDAADPGAADSGSVPGEDAAAGVAAHAEGTRKTQTSPDHTYDSWAVRPGCPGVPSSANPRTITTQDNP